MTFCDETARLAKEKLAAEYQSINVERVVIGLFFSGFMTQNNEDECEAKRGYPPHIRSRPRYWGCQFYA